MPFEIYRETLVGTDRADVKRTETHHALAYGTDDGYGEVRMSLAARDDEVVWLRTQQADDEGDVLIPFDALAAAYVALCRAEGRDASFAGPLTEEQREDVARVVERVAEFLRLYPAEGGTVLAGELRSAMLQLIDLASRRVIPGTAPSDA